MPITVQEAENMVDEVCKRWVSLGREPDTLYMYTNHIKGAAHVAQTVALKMGNMNPEQMYVSALLHDIAKIDESSESMLGRFHGILGYEMLKDRDPAVARACLLHEFPMNKISMFKKKFLGNESDYSFVLNYVADNPLKDEDLLIQLADSMANRNGIVTMEQRQQEYEERFNIKMTAEMIEPFLEIKSYFGKKIGQDIYSLFVLKSQDFLQTKGRDR